MNKKHAARFKELEIQLAEVGNTKSSSYSEMFGSRDYVDGEMFHEWRVKTKNLLVKSCGADSEHYKEFISGEKPGSMESSFSVYKRLKAIFNAAQEDFEGEYLSSVKMLVQAEVFESELEQAQELLDSGYRLASAVIAGIVLETGLRELCNTEDIPIGKLDKMNSDLAKKGIYNKLEQKRITALADIRNSAAHGKPDEFSADDVTLMIRDIERFLINYLS